MSRTELQLIAIFLVVSRVIWSAPVFNPYQGFTKKRADLLKRYGYLDEGSPNGSSSALPVDVLVQAITDIQTFAGIPVTGVLDNQTVELLESDRCGVKDFDKKRQASPLDPEVGIIGSFTLQGSAWRKQDLTFKVVSYTQDLPPEEQLRIFKTAFMLWQAATTLTITEVTDDDADILISFVSRDHSDGYAFDGPGGTLAHAFYPHNNRGLSGDAHFDDDESFTTGTPNGINLDWVAVHEFGHSLGLAHSSVGHSIMYPWYRGHKENIELSDDDVGGIQGLYGSPLQPTTQQPTTQQPTTERPTTQEPTTPEPTTQEPTTQEPTTQEPTTQEPTTQEPTTQEPTTQEPTTQEPTTQEPTTQEPTTQEPTTQEPTTPEPTTPEPTTQEPTTPEPTTQEPTTQEPTTQEPTTQEPTTQEPTTQEPITQEPTTQEPTTQEPTTQEPITTQIPQVLPYECNLRSYDAFFNGADGKTYAVSGEYYWNIVRHRAGKESGPHKLKERFPFLQTPVDAVFTKHGKTVFFRGSRYWQYRYDVYNQHFVVERIARLFREYGLPSDLNDMDAAFVYRNTRIYFFKGDLYWRYNEMYRRIDIGYPRNISQGWSDLTGPLDGAMTWGSDLKSYFFKGENYFRISMTAHQVESGYPQNIAMKWMKCYHTLP